MRPWIGLNSVLVPSAASREVSFKNPEDAEGFKNAEDDEDESQDGEDAVLSQESVNSKVKLEQTSYDALVVAVICSKDEAYCQHHGQSVTRMWLLTAILFHIFVICLQLTIVFFLLVTTVQTAAAPLQDGIDAKTKIIWEAVAEKKRLHVDQQPMEICEKMDTLRGGHLLIQFIWSARMLQEFVDAMWRAFYIHALQRQYSASDRMLQEDSQGEILLTHASPGTAWMLLVMSSVPQCLCAGLLWWTGAKFLFFAHSMGTLVMKSISIAFVTTLDEMMFKSFAAQGFKDVVKKSKYLFTTVQPTHHFYMWGFGVVKFVTAFSLAGFIYWGVFGNVTAFRNACWEYWSVFPADIPNRGSESLWTTFLKSLELK